jgi:ribonuclease Y
MTEAEAAVNEEFMSRLRKLERVNSEDLERKARVMLATVIQRVASSHAVETTTTAVHLPNDEMKGRIIGKEGRNIKAVENLTGCEIIIDDTPGAITISGFSPIRRQVARLALEKLIEDGRIHPTRIEEVIDKSRKEVDLKIREAGEQAAFEADVHGVHPELIKLLGRLQFRTSYGQNVLAHSLECCYIAGLMAAELKGDYKLARRAARIARYTRSGVRGSAVIRTPTASRTALATAAEMGIVLASPTPLAPKGPCRYGRSRIVTSSAGASSVVGMA